MIRSSIKDEKQSLKLSIRNAKLLTEMGFDLMDIFAILEKQNQENFEETEESIEKLLSLLLLDPKTIDSSQIAEKQNQHFPISMIELNKKDLDISIINKSKYERKYKEEGDIILSQIPIKVSASSQSETFLKCLICEDTSLPSRPNITSEGLIKYIKLRVALIKSSGNFIISIRGCKHYFCKECLKEYFTYHINCFNFHMIKCPSKTCEVRLNLNKDHALFEELLSDDLLLKLRKVEINHLVSTSQNRLMFCPFPDCDSYAKTDNSDYWKNSISGMKLQANNKLNIDVLQKFVVCGNEHRFCAECKGSWHINMQCKEAEEILFYHYLQNCNGLQKNCPQCGIWIEKHKGCNHMICLSCKYEWCWLCNDKYSDDHYIDPSSRCFNRMYGVGIEGMLNIQEEMLEFNQQIINANIERFNEELRQLRLRMISAYNPSYSIGSGNFEIKIEYDFSFLHRCIYGIILFIFLFISSITNYIYIRNARKSAEIKEIRYKSKSIKFLVGRMELIMYVAYILCNLNYGMVVTLFYYFPLIIKYCFTFRKPPWDQINQS